MSISDSLTAMQQPIQFGALRPERLYVHDESLQDALGDHLVRLTRQGKSKKGRVNPPYITLAQLTDRDVRAILTEFDFGDNKPSWLDNAIEELNWARSFQYQHQQGVATIVGGTTLVLQCPFTLTLSEALAELPVDSLRWSESLRGWIIVGADLESPELNSIFETYGVNLSPLLQATMAGNAFWEEILGSHVQRAAQEGYRVPDIFPTQRSFREHQEQAVVAIAGLKRSLLADQVGLGKSGEFISSYLSIVQNHVENGGDESEVWPIALVTTNSLKEELAEEIMKWKEDAVIEVLYGTTRTPISPDAQFVVLNVDILAARREDLEEARIKGLIVDEAHTLKNIYSNRGQAALELTNFLRGTSGGNEFIVLASGTPFLNRPEELWALLCILGWDHEFADIARRKLRSTKQKIWTKRGWIQREMNEERMFQSRWCEGHNDQYTKRWVSSGVSNSAELNQLLLDKGMIRRRKSDIMSPMPPLNEMILPIEMNEHEQKEYDRIDQKFADWMKEQARETAAEEGISIKEAIRIVATKLRNAEGVMRMTALRRQVGRGKVAGIVKWIHEFMSGDLTYVDPATNEQIRVGDDPDRQKLIVFAHHRDVQSALIEHPDLQQYGLLSIQSGDNPQDSKVRFQKDPRARLMICYSGAREGHTLTAAKDILLAEIPMVPSWIVQMAGRCWARISEDFEPHEATIWFSMAPATIDVSVIRMNQRKKLSFNAIIDGEDTQELEAEDSGGEDQDQVIIDMVMKGHRKMGIAL